VLPFLCGVGLLVGGGCGALLARRSWATAVGVGSAIAGCAAGLVPAGLVLLGAPSPSIRIPWHVPGASLSAEIDALSAVFLLPVFGLPALAAVYGAGYVAAEHDGGRPGTSWFFFNLLVASMAVVVVARNAVLFLVAWEVMALSSFFLVTHHDEDEAVREAGWTYLVATHLGTAWLLALFVLLARGTGSFDFDRFGPAAGAGTLFVLAVVGFGSKAGFVPFHVWLPEAHPAAPPHVSAVMSGVMIKTGIYGLLRALTFLGPLPGWAGWVLVAIGAMSAVFGILSAIAQHELKRLLAYSSVENVGIVALALGLGLVGLETRSPVLAVLAFGGALLHTLNHAVFKGLLFLAAGAVARGTGTGRIDALGGLLARMPRTGLAFLTGAVAIAGLPPLNGFVSELLVYLAALRGAVALEPAGAIPAVVAIAALALVGSLALACFAQAFGVVFLGAPRTDAAARAGEPGWRMRAPVEALAATCVAVALGAPALLRALVPVLARLTGLSDAAVRSVVADACGTLGWVTGIALALVAGVVGAALLRRRVLSRRSVAAADIWDCGYARPSPRMQYTASSFGQPLVELFRPLVGTVGRLAPPDGFFPRGASFASETPDLWRVRLYRPAFAGVGRALAAFRWVQHGRVQLYVLYIAFTLLVLLLWKVGWT
jgi:formate hydrogenlyase subunit 3/multisubunit Na+/H+ antiporter MnhD subunit